jgi:hypothetical protein
MEFDVARAFKTSSSIVNVAFGIPLSLVTGKTVVLCSCLHSKKQSLDFYQRASYLFILCIS